MSSRGPKGRGDLVGPIFQMGRILTYASFFIFLKKKGK